MKNIIRTLVLCSLASPVAAFDYTNVDAVKPVIGQIKGQWAAIQVHGAQDWVYFTNVLSWRCAIQSLEYGLNGAEPTQVFEFEPCYTDLPNPHVFQTEPPQVYFTQPDNSIQSLTVKLTYTDGSVSEARFERADIFLP